MEMTRDEALASYRPLRAAIRRVLGDAVGACSRTDLMRAAKQLGCWADNGIAVPEDGGDEALEMISDIALFEPNQRKRRAYDRFLAGPAQQLDAPDLALAQRMAGAWFSVFRCAGRHKAAGVWLQDLLDGDRRFWMVDEGLEASAPEGTIFGVRLFDAGPFHAGFGVIAHPDEETVQTCVQMQASSGRTLFRHSLAATLYGDDLRERLPISAEQEELLQVLLGPLLAAEPSTQAPNRRKRPPRP